MLKLILIHMKRTEGSTLNVESFALKDCLSLKTTPSYPTVPIEVWEFE